jgi:F0F1-type ATP synthase assembly protein I
LEKEKNQKEKRSKYSGLEQYAKYTGIAFQMIAIILVFVWGGIKLDEKYRKGEPLFVIIFSLIGVFAGLYIALKDFIRFKK